MTKNLISKYYYHYYVIFMIFILGISAVYSISFVNFYSTKAVNIFTLIASFILYFGIILYFYFLIKKQQWVIPRTWSNVQKRPLLYCFIIFPIFFIPLFWINFSKLIPMTYTNFLGAQSTETIEAYTTKNTYKGNTTYCLSNKYSCLPIFKINRDEFEYYQDKKIILQITSKKSSFGTIIESIDHIQF